MDYKHTILLAVSLSFTTQLMASNDGLPETLVFKVVDLANKKTIMEGDETVSQKAHETLKVTQYRDLQGKLVQKESIVFDSQTLTTTSFQSENFAVGEKINLQKNGDSYKLTYKESKDSTESNHIIEPIGKKVIGKVLHNLTVRNWEKLMAKVGVALELLVPSQQKSFDFNLVQSEETEGILKLSLEPDSWLIRKLVDSMYFYYSKTSSPLLIKYEGPTTVLLKDGYPDKIRIDFTYPKDTKGAR